MRRPFLALPVLAVTLGLALSACAESPTSLTTVDQSVSFAQRGGEAGSSMYWNEVARGLVVKYNANAFQAIRGYAILSVAQYNAVVAAERDVGGGPRASVRAAVSRASAVALSYVFPGEAAALDAMATDFVIAAAWRGEDAAAGDAAGQIAADHIVARARTDGFFTPWSGTVPVGPGFWFSSATPPAPPVGVLFGRVTPYFLRSGDQFRPAPPPAFDSPEFIAALGEVRSISDTRTPEQAAIARSWALPQGTYGPPGYWNEEGARLAKRYRLRESAVTHLFALMNMAGFDAIIAAHDAKYTYWTIRPTQADPAITLAVGLPNFPSYVSNHSAVSTAMATLLGDEFPAEQRRLDALSEEAGLSRLYGGIHYRFDLDAGAQLGREVAAWARQHDVVGHQPFVFE
jgi:hypothetical protein